MSQPPTDTVPAVGLVMPQMILMSVVLPAPFGPSSAKISPRLISRSTFFNAANPEAYILLNPLTEIMESEPEDVAFIAVSYTLGSEEINFMRALLFVAAALTLQTFAAEPPA